MAHLSTDIRLSALDVLDWLLETNGEAAISCAGGWVKTLRTFKTLLSWNSESTVRAAGNWSSTKSTSNNLGSSKLLVRQLTTLSHVLAVGLRRPSLELEYQRAARRAAQLFPLCQTDAHLLPKKSNPFGYLNLFGAVRDIESEMYETAEDRVEIFCELGLEGAFRKGVDEAKKEGGEVGRAAALVANALKMADQT